jgi:hypothetical protein
MIAIFALFVSVTTAQMDQLPWANAEFGKAAGMMVYQELFPLYVSEHTLRDTTMTKLEDPHVPNAPLCMLGRQRLLADPTVTFLPSPALDSLYESWYCVVDRPYFVDAEIPEDRYQSLEFKRGSDLWPLKTHSPFAGTGRAKYFVVTDKIDAYLKTALGPQWRQTISAYDYKEIISPSDVVWMVGRTQIFGTDDYEAAHAIQDQVIVRPIEEVLHPNHPIIQAIRDFHGADRVPYSPNPYDPATCNPDDVACQQMMTAFAFYFDVGQYIQNTPVNASHAGAFWNYAERAGITPHGFDPSVLLAGAADGIVPAVLEMQGIVALNMFQWGYWDGPWTAVISEEGFDQLDWCTYCHCAKSALAPSEAIYSFAFTDSMGQYMIGGAYSYVVHFTTPPPVDPHGYWSLTVYDMQQMLVLNSINRYHLASYNDMQYNADGSLDIYVSCAPPTDPQMQNNWLPTICGGPFMLEIRAFMPPAASEWMLWKAPSVLVGVM